MKNSDETSYKQPVKNLARSKALTHAVELLTIRRQDAAITPKDYVQKVHKECSYIEYGQYAEASAMCSEEDMQSWSDFRTSVVGDLKPSNLTIAYLAGPEPTNDIKILLNLGIRPENIWAFEISDDYFQRAISDVKNKQIRGIKLIKMKMEDYFAATPRRFDIIYCDACAPFPSHEQKTLKIISSIFRHSSLNSLGVLITNFSAPDISKETDLENYSHLISSYLYAKESLDFSDGNDFYPSDSAEASGYLLSPETMSIHDIDDIDDIDDDKYLIDSVKSNFNFYYSSFITRHIIDLASIIAPTERLTNSALWRNMFEDQNLIIEKSQRWITPTDQNNDLNEDTYYYDHIFEGGNFSLVKTLSYLDVGKKESTFYSKTTRTFINRWLNQLTDCDGKTEKSINNILTFYACKDNTNCWTESMLDMKTFNYRMNMPHLCDVPTEELGFYPIFAQFSYPAHCNIKESKRYSYIAEGKQNRMFLDVLPFDECRYIYDWLSSGHLVASDLEKISTQLTFRFALDSLSKNLHHYQGDFLYGSHVIPLSTDFDSSSLQERLDLSATSNIDDK